MATEAASKGKRVRSPAYPAIDLKTSIDKARDFYNVEKRASANVVVAASHWGYQFASSGGKGVLAALLSFGLMEDEGVGDKRQVKLTDLALRILLDTREDSKDRRDAIKRAALQPKIHQEILAKWPTLPSDANLKHYLVLDRKFNENSVDEFIRELRSTVSFAGLVESDTIIPTLKDKDETKHEEKSPNQIAIGSFVQCEIGGVQQFQQPRRVTGLSDDGQFVFVEGSATGLPVGGITVQEVKDQGNAGGLLPAPPIRQQTGFKQDVFSLHEGNVILQWPEGMSKDSFEDFESWVKLQLRKIARTVKPA